MNYIVVSGYYNPGRPQGEEFFRLWVDNTYKFLNPKRIYVVNAGCKEIEYRNCEWLNLTDNLGHVKHIPEIQLLGGWSASFLMGCFLAYHCKCDILYKEQDCLAFGNYIDVLYRELGDFGMIVGQHNSSPSCAGQLAQSLVVARHEYLLEFIQNYLSITLSDKKVDPEHKFDFIMTKSRRITQMSIGYDRSRPVNYSDPAFYMQQVTPQELTYLRLRGFV